MTSPTPRDVLSLDTPEGQCACIAAMSEPSAELLDRALVGFERFAATAQGESDA
ncbi:hypothetical protein ACTVZO_44820 [Streptomyces sp. IBSNAI002]|uniref:hypothetical protein n=1 Tax=Streptomyces sp. IBSNAI002 TaxID=3457500 RepID=UPI003FD0434A